ncbi:hypothetical protein ACI68E_004288 [Malassezia pachydermatis]|uniref:Uncharacterized protein n=1 Tax=Malassezia pachydermatis TaxID=77020 RepID=A0A0M8MND3_9BASI|nr:hypothetical protein Malapachy_1894 [Malassezia pachydermatis]KOS13587.1 hypothetical protein Malapachy_1894 [Malassezia pachydermatis]
MSKCTPCIQKTLLALLAVLSMATGVFISYKAIHEKPKPNFEYFSSLSLTDARTVLGLDPQSRWIPGQAAWTEKAEHFFLLLIYVFKLMGSQNVGRGGFMFIMSMSMPIMMFTMVQSIKPDTNVLLRGVAITLVYLLGQLICVGAAVPLVYLPLFIFVRAMNLSKVYPDRAFGEKAPGVIKLVNMVAGAPAILSFVIPVNHWAWMPINVVFQVFPLVFLGLSLYLFMVGPQRSVTSSKVSVLYEDNMLMSMVIYWYSLYKLVPFLRMYRRGEPIALNDGEKLILWDSLGMFLTLIYFVLVDMIADIQLKNETGKPLHSASPVKWILGTIKSTLMALVVGPGAVMDIYLAAREDTATPLHASATVRKRQ